MLSKTLLHELEEYIHDHITIPKLEMSYKMEESNVEELESKVELQHFIEMKRKPSLNQLLFDYIDKKGKSDTDIYKKAGIDRRHFSKIRSNTEYRPKKQTVVALALALELSKQESEELLNSAGYSLSDSDTFDLIIQFFLEREHYDINEVNEALVHFQVKALF